MTAVLIDEHHQLKLLSLASFLYLIAVLIRMDMGRFLIDIYPISLFTSIREEQGLNMEAVSPVYHSRKHWCWTNSLYRTMSHAPF